MYSVVREIESRALWAQTVPSLAISLAFAEVFFKFGSFTLEAVAFLALWWSLDAIIAATVGRRN